MPVIVGTYGASTKEKLIALEAMVEQELLKRAVSQRAVKSIDDAVVRDLRPTDVGQAPDPGWHYVLVSLRDVEPTLRSFRIRDGNIFEEPVVLE